MSSARYGVARARRRSRTPAPPVASSWMPFSVGPSEASGVAAAVDQRRRRRRRRRRSAARGGRSPRRPTRSSRRPPRSRSSSSSAPRSSTAVSCGTTRLAGDDRRRGEQRQRPAEREPEQLRVRPSRDVHGGEAEAETAPPSSSATTATAVSGAGGWQATRSARVDRAVGSAERARRLRGAGPCARRAGRARGRTATSRPRRRSAARLIASLTVRSPIRRATITSASQRHEPGDHPLGDRPDVVDPPARRVGRVAGPQHVAGERVELRAGRSAWSRSAASGTGPSAPPRRSAAAVACWRSGTCAPSVSPPRATIWWQPAQLSVKTCSPSARLPAAGFAVGAGGPAEASRCRRSSASICVRSNARRAALRAPRVAARAASGPVDR